MLLVVLLFVLCGVWWVWAKWGRVKRFWADRGVPYSPPHPIWGSLTFLTKENTAYWLRRIYDAKVPYVGAWLFWQPCLVVNSPELARNILVKHSDNFRDRYLNSGKTDPLGSLNLFVVNDPLWSNLRRKLTPVFTAAKLRSLQGLMREKAQDLVRRIEQDTEKYHEIRDLRGICSDFTTDVIGESAFGVKSEATRTGDSAIRAVTRDIMHYNIPRGVAFTSIFFFPAIVDIFRFKFFPKESMKLLRRLFQMMVAQRGGFDKKITESRDLLDALLKLRQDAAIDKEDMSEDLLLAQAAVFVQAGFDTSGTTFSWTIYELAHQPELQEKLYKELVEAKEKHGTENFDSTQLSELLYLNAILKETLRKFPPMGWMDRLAAQSYKVDEKLTIPAGTVVYINSCGIQMDPEYYPRPEIYDPERFMPESNQEKPYTYMPFGEGPRNCIGKRYAYQTMRTGLAAIFLKYTVRPAPGAPAPNHVQVERKGVFFNPEEDLPVIFTRRS